MHEFRVSFVVIDRNDKVSHFDAVVVAKDTKEALVAAKKLKRVTRRDLVRDVDISEVDQRSR